MPKVIQKTKSRIAIVQPLQLALKPLSTVPIQWKHQDLEGEILWIVRLKASSSDHSFTTRKSMNRVVNKERSSQLLEGAWIPLSDYSSKHKVSVSTLRRRIKAEDIHFRFEDGKYFLLDEPMGTQQKEHRPSQTRDSSLMGAYSGGSDQVARPASSSNIQSQGQMFDEESVLAVANQLLTELKKAYMMILQPIAGRGD